MLRKEQAQTQWERDQKEAARQDEVKRRELARRALDAMSSQVIQSWLMQQKEVSPSQKEFLRQALKWYQELAADTGNDPQSGAGVAAAHRQIGQIRRRLGQRDEAEAAFRQSQSLYAQLIVEHPNEPGYRHGLAQTHQAIGGLLALPGSWSAEAEAAYEHAQKILEKLVEEFPAVPEYLSDLGACHLALGHLLKVTERRGEAEKAYKRALEVFEKLADESHAPEDRYALSLGHNSLGGLLGEWGRPDGEKHFREAAAIQDQLIKDFPDVAEYRNAAAFSHNNVGLSATRNNRPGEALEEYGRALGLRKGLVADFPAVPDYQHTLAITYRSLGELYLTCDRVAEAEQAYRAGLELFASLTQKYPAVQAYRSDLASALGHMGRAQFAAGKGPEAEKTLRQALAEYRELVQAFPRVAEYASRKSTVHGELGDVLLKMGRLAQAEQEYEQALAIQTKLVQNHPKVVYYPFNLALTLVRLGDLKRSQRQPAAALESYGKAIETLANNPERDNPGNYVRQILVAAHMGRAQGLDHLGQFREALSEWDLVMRLEPEPAASTRLRRAMTLLHLGDHAAAAAAARQMAAQKGIKPDDMYNAACVYSRSAAALQKDTALSETDRARLRGAYTQEALGLLREAFARGYRDIAQLKKDPDLDALRDRVEFRKLVEELDAKLKTEAGKKP
jgi:tetratricopeptide (TPR) repeat protein